MEGIWTQLGLVGLLVIVNAAFAGSEIALISLRETQIAQLENDSARGRVLAGLVRDPNRFLSTIQIGITLAGFLASASAAVTLAEPLVGPLDFLGGAARAAAITIVTIGVSFLTLVIGELAPKRIAMQRAVGWGLAVARPLHLLGRLARPAVWLLGVTSDLVVRLAGADPERHGDQVSEEELRDMVATQETMTADERFIVAGAFEFADRKLRQIVVPRPQVVSLPRDLPAAEAIVHLAENSHSRAPVVGESLDDVVGTVQLRALVDVDGTVGDHMQSPLILPETVGALHALRLLQAHRQQLAVVVNEHGAVEGIITVEDLVEELVGEIWDEDDPDVRGVQRHDDGSLALPGSFPVHDLVDIGVSLPSGDYTTVAGAVLDHLGRLPDRDESVDVGDWRLTVVERTDRAISRVRMQPHAAAEGRDIDVSRVHEGAISDSRLAASPRHRSDPAGKGEIRSAGSGRSASDGDAPDAAEPEREAGAGGATGIDPNDR